MSIPTLLYMASYLCFSAAVIGATQLIAPFRFPESTATSGERGGSAADRAHPPSGRRSARLGRPHTYPLCAGRPRHPHQPRSRQA